MFIKINSFSSVKTIIKIKIKNLFINFISNALRRSKINHIVSRRHNSSSLNSETRSILNRHIDFFNKILSIQLITDRRISKNFSKNISKITLKIEIFNNRSVFIMTTITIKKKIRERISKWIWLRKRRAKIKKREENISNESQRRTTVVDEINHKFREN